MKISTNLKTTSSKGLLITAVILLFFGSLATYGMSSVVIRAWQQYAWVSTNCTITHSEYIPEKYGVESVSVKYSYEVNGKSLSGNRYALPTNVSHDDSFYQSEVERYAIGTVTECFYDPSNISDLVLVKTTLGSAFVILIPLIFLFAGLGLLKLNSHLKKESEKSLGLFSHPANKQKKILFQKERFSFF